jgi:hypothetical protein
MSAATVVYLLCAATSALCAGLLVRAYLASRTRLLLWSAICFLGLLLNNVLLVVDERVIVGTDLGLLRDLTGLAAVSVLLFGLIWESR